MKKSFLYFCIVTSIVLVSAFLIYRSTPKQRYVEIEGIVTEHNYACMSTPQQCSIKINDQWHYIPPKPELLIDNIGKTVKLKYWYSGGRNETFHPECDGCYFKYLD